MSKRPSAITIAVAAAVGALAVLALWVGASAAFMPFCGSCHLSGEFGTATAAAPHAGTDCASCHGGTTVQSRIEFGVAQVFGMHLGLLDPDPTLSTVVSAKCRSCHAEALVGVTENAGLRVKHKACAVGKECTDCHSPTAHGNALKWPRSADMDMCYTCHAKSGSSTKCDTCHIDKDRLPADRVQTGTFSVTHGPNFRKTHGMGAMATCGSCHEESRCIGCHGAGVPHRANFVREHAAVSRTGRADCIGCHRKEFCSDCHRYEMPHPRSFKPEHPEIVKKNGNEGCMRCHDGSDCVTCHEMHVHPTTLEQLEGLGVIERSGEATR